MVIRSLFLSLLGCCWVAVAAAELAVPELRERVTDLTGTLDATQRQALETKLATFEQERGSQLAVLLVPSTQPETIEQYSIRVTDTWKLGRKESDDGVLLLVAKDDRAVRIEVGQGLEGVLPDAITKRIIEETIVPRFRDGDFAGGIEAGADQILGLVRGEALPEPAPRRAAFGGSFSGDAIGLLLVGAIFVGQFLRRLLGRLLGAGAAGGIVFALAMLLLGTLGMAIALALAAMVLSFIGFGGGGAGRGGHWRGGGFGGGGFGGGGFSGGGGGFSGGGASGRW